MYLSLEKEKLEASITETILKSIKSKNMGGWTVFDVTFRFKMEYVQDDGDGYDIESYECFAHLEKFNPKTNKRKTRIEAITIL